MIAEKINYVYIGTVLFVLSCYGCLEWWNVQAHNFVFFGVLLVLLVCLRLQSLRKFWGVLVCTMFLLLGACAGSNAPPNPAKQLQPYFQQEVLAYGSIVPESVKSYPYGTSFVLRCEKLYVEKGIDSFVKGNSKVRNSFENLEDMIYEEIGSKELADLVFNAGGNNVNVICL